MAKFDRFVTNLPKVFKPQVNPIVAALLKAWAQEDDTIVQQLKNTNAQIFVKTAQGQYLDRLASGLNVSRPVELGLLDADFSNVIPNLSFKAKQIRKTMLDLLDATWGPLFSHTNVSSANLEPFNVSPGDTLQVQIDNLTAQTITVKSGQIATPGAATATEIATILSQLIGATISLVKDPVSGNNQINIRTNTVGLQGKVNILGGSMAASGELNLPIKLFLLTDLPQRTAIYELRNKELVIELPALFPIIRPSLRGSHHFHADATLQGPVAPNDGIWQGSFIYSTTQAHYEVTSAHAMSLQQLNKGEVYTTLTVDNAANIPDAPGFLIFDWGLNGQEEPVKYIGRPNNSTLLLSPDYVFQKTHPIGTNINYLANLDIVVPRSTGIDLPIYLTSPAGTRTAIQTLLSSLVAAGVVVRFEILLPEYYHDLVVNPYA